MDPSTLALLGAGLLSGRGGGGSKLSSATNLANTIGITTPTTQTFGLSLANNPTIANMIGAGSMVAPSAGGSSLPFSVSPSVSAPTSTTANPSQSAADGGSGGGLPGFLPRSSPTGAYGIGAGFATPGILSGGNDLLLLLLICGGAALLLMEG